MILWIFGDSFSTNYRVDLNESWPSIIGKQLDCKVKNFAHCAVDNFFIYSQYLEQKSNIKDSDIVIIQWSNPSRKMFIYNKDNKKHKLEYLAVTRNSRTYFRCLPNTDQDKWGLINLQTNTSGIEFFDTWYEDYYNSYESSVNLQAYQDATKKENITHLYFDKIFNYIKNHKLYISEDNLHPDVSGHAKLAEIIMEKLKWTIK